MIISGISIDSLLRAQEKFELFRQDMVSERDYAGAIQAYEYCFELAWKTMKRVLEQRGMIANSPRETFRIAARIGLISDAEMWFEFMKERNHTVHCYDQEVVDDVVDIFPLFSVELRKFLVNLARSE
jgi:nucleotidyltransferase substrate binding protein (TIGR01987 family)